MPDYIRVRDKETGHHVSILRSQFDRNPDAWSELQQPATFGDGSPRPVKYKTSVDQKAADNTAAKTAETKEK